MTEDEVVPYLLELASSCVMTFDNQLILNYPTDTSLHLHLINYEDYLKKRLKLPELLKVEWVMRSTVFYRAPKYLHL